MSAKNLGCFGVIVVLLLFEWAIEALGKVITPNVSRVLFIITIIIYFIYSMNNDNNSEKTNNKDGDVD